MVSTLDIGSHRSRLNTTSGFEESGIVFKDPPTTGMILPLPPSSLWTLRMDQAGLQELITAGRDLYV